MIDYLSLAFHVEPMSVQDIDAVMAIEYEAFSAPWSTRAYDYELRYNEIARYFVARPQNGIPTPITPAKPAFLQRLLARGGNRIAESPHAPLVGYGGFWLMVDDAHISTLATHRDWRQRGIGELLLLAMIDGAAESGMRAMTLEVRVSNVSAQALYRKYGFEVVGERKQYYSDNGEDALIMTTPRITTAEYQYRMQELKATLFVRLSR
jgi:ribosomal-protein-alanine N-acetyltransferase